MNNSQSASASLQIGQKTRLAEIEITFEDVVIDSRCPADMDCEWSGVFVSKFTLARGEQTQVIYGALVMDKYMTVTKAKFDSVEARLAQKTYFGDNERKPLRIFDHLFRITSVEPSKPPHDETIPKDSYKVTLEVSPVTGG